jgi:hypothetical protein
MGRLLGFDKLDVAFDFLGPHIDVLLILAM